MSMPKKMGLTMRIIQGILKSLLKPHLATVTFDNSLVVSILNSFNANFKASLTDSAKDQNVVGFKSVACYRTGLDVATSAESEAIVICLKDVSKMYQETGTIRIAHKALNDHVVRMALEISGEYQKPGFVCSFFFFVNYSLIPVQYNFTQVLGITISL